jgi:hypothetical protein
MNWLRRAATATLLAAVLLAGCDGGTAPSPDPTGTPATPIPTATPAVVIGTPAAPPVTPTLPPTFEDCGTEALPQGATALDDRGRDCILRAFAAGEPAAFTTTRPTTEGDPITTRIEVVGVAEVRVSVDATRDRFSAPVDRVVKTYVCTMLSSVTSIGGTRQLSVTGCAGGAAFRT